MTAVYAHRGNTARALENTLEAFADARAAGADGVELDARLTADGAVMVHHDPEIEGLGPIGAMEVGRLPVSVPLLTDALVTCAGMRVNVELKASGTAGVDQVLAASAAAIVDELGRTDQVLVSSFHRALLDAVRTDLPALELGWLLGWTANVDQGLDEAIEAGYQALHPFVAGVTGSLVDRAHAAGMGVNVWTVNATADLEAMIDLGVDAVITDRVEVALGIARKSRLAEPN